MSIKGYPSQQKEDRLKAEFATIEPISENKHGLSALAHGFVFAVVSDAVEAGSTTSIINATAHVALKGDVIRFTSGAFNNRQFKVYSTATNTITLAETLSAAPSAGDTFEILRHSYARVASDGGINVTSGPLQFKLDGSDSFVIEDTVTPANNRPLPVKLTGFTGDITVTAQELNVSLDHANDSVKVGDGTDLLAITAAGEANVRTAQLPAALGQLASAASTSVVIASDQSTVPVSATISGASSSIQITDGVETLSITGSGQAEVAVTSALPAGTNNIGDVDVITQPARSHTTDSIRLGDGVDLVNVTAANQLETAVTAALPAGTNNIGDVDVLSQPVRSHTADSIRIGDGTDLVNVTAANQLEVAVTAALPAGTNNIGDVDVLTQPARSHTTDSVRIGDGTDLVSVTAAGQMEVSVTAALPAGTNNIGDVDVLTEPATASDGGALPAVVKVVGGYDGANVQAISTNTSGAVNVVQAALSIVDLLDTPLLQASSSNIPASAANPLEVVASLASAVRKLQILDTTGEFIGIYTGAALSEVLLLVVGPGSDQTIEASIAASTRISVRNMKNATITTGDFAINFIG